MIWELIDHHEWGDPFTLSDGNGVRRKASCTDEARSADTKHKDVAAPRGLFLPYR